MDFFLIYKKYIEFEQKKQKALLQSQLSFSHTHTFTHMENV